MKASFKYEWVAGDSDQQKKEDSNRLEEAAHCNPPSQEAS